ncbi:MAG: hypothetical protein M9933_15890 [Chitinophagaceae bacterium]|nr:hypothetical protein [Chitinophagaceae bacterium]
MERENVVIANVRADRVLRSVPKGRTKNQKTPSKQTGLTLGRADRFAVGTEGQTAKPKNIRPGAQSQILNFKSQIYT